MRVVFKGEQRPSKAETDEDLTREQELFFQSRKERAVEVNQVDEQENACCEENKKNDFEIIEDVDVKDVAFDVKERDVKLSEPFTFKPPSVESIDMTSKKLKSSKFASKRKSESIFSQLIEKTEGSKDSEKLLGFALIDGSGLCTEKQETELKKIHEENLAKISSMSLEEIQSHQSQLKKHLDPDVVRFIQSKRNLNKTALQTNNGHENCSTSKTNKFMFSDKAEDCGEVLQKEGKSDCDTILLEKAMGSETNIKIKSSINTSSSESKSIEIPEETKKLLSCVKKGQWRNMNKIEKEKLEWIQELPKPNPIDTKTGFTARFDFEGKLLAHDVKTPTYKGLHHHGEEPEVAGYSMEELFLLARSTLQSQRITALHTLAHILDNYWYGMMDGCFDEPLLPMMLEAGIVPLLRWALDDISLTSIAATVTAIHSLLICKPDELCLQRTFCWLNGHVMPQVEPPGLIEPDFVIEELTDADLIKLDVIKAFLRMDILPRFLYILQALEPPPLVCKLIIEICAHFAQHSLVSANQVSRYPGLLKLIFIKFLPMDWQFVDGSTLSDSADYKCPMPSAMKLMRIIASSSKELALYLVKHYDLVSNIILYLTLQPNDEKVPIQDVQVLVIETLKAFQILLCYGIAFQIFLELFPIFMRQMDFCLSLDLNFEKSRHLRDFDYATHLFKTFNTIAVVSTEQGNQRDSSEAAINAIFQRALICLKKWLWQFPKENPTDHAIVLLAGCMNFVSTVNQKLHQGLVCEDLKPCSETKEIFKTYLLPFMKSNVFKTLLKKIESCSTLLNSSKSGNTRDGKTIVSLGSILWKDDIIPILKENSPIPLLLAVLKFSILQKQLYTDITPDSLEEFLKDNSVTEYLRKISTKRLNVNSWFARYESHFISLLLQFLSLMKPGEFFLWHKAAASILPTLRTPDECIIEDILENIIFNSSFFLSFDKKSCQEIISKLPIISKCYVTCLLDSGAIFHSRKLLYGSRSLGSVAALSNSPFLLSSNWCYTPILETYQDFTERRKGKRIAPEKNLQLINCLEWIFLCHELTLPVLKHIPASMEFGYLCMVFLLDDDFFRSSNVKVLLEGCFQAFLKHKKFNLAELNAGNEFDYLYERMLYWFCAVSYCDELFGNFLLFPLQQCFPSKWREELLLRHSEVLCFLCVPLSKIFVPVRNYLEPFETDLKILSCYHHLLVLGALTHVRCPLIYLVAIHHINHFLFVRQDELKISQKSLISKILESKPKDVQKQILLQRQILLYSEVKLDTEFGFIMKNELSESDKSHLNDLYGRSVNVT